MVVVWNTERCLRGGEVQLLAKAHTDVDIQRLHVAHFDDTRYTIKNKYNINVLVFNVILAYNNDLQYGVMRSG